MLDLIDLTERGFVPDAMLRTGIRWLLDSTATRDSALEQVARTKAIDEFAAMLRRQPLAVATQAANEQHYEVPARFFRKVLGPRLKYSCCLWPRVEMSLAEAEEIMLATTCQRAEIADGQTVLDLGGGWGALALWIAEHYPRCRVLAVSNSHGQREFIEARRDELGLGNLECRTADIRHFEPDREFDRVVSIEMLEHLRNYELLFGRISRWLHPAGKLFVHVFSYRHAPYLFETDGAIDWMGRHFFTGGLMPSDDLLPQFQRDLRLEADWCVSGRHYARTCEAWLDNLDARDERWGELFAAEMPAAEAAIQLQRWRMFFIACAELFAHDRGDTWRVMHYRFANKRN